MLRHPAISARARRSAALPRDERGFTLTELLITLSLVGVGMAAAFAAYLGSIRSWEGTARLADLQRDAGLTARIITREVREGSEVVIGAGADSIAIYYDTGSSDSLAAEFVLDAQGRLIDLSGDVVATGVDSLVFSSADGKTVNMDVLLRGDMGTAMVGDDQVVLVSSTAVCRN